MIRVMEPHHIITVTLLLLCWPKLLKATKPLLRVAGFGWEPYLKMPMLPESSSVEPLPGGFDMDVVRIIAKKLDVDINFQRSATWGSMNKNGSWTGTVGKIVRGEADVGIQLSVIYSRFLYVDFSIPIDFPQKVLFSKKPLPLPQHFNLLKPFCPSIWILMVITMIVSMLMEYLLNLQTSPSKIWCDNISCILKLSGLLLSQANSTFKNSPHSRLIFALSWLFFATILGMAYDCNLRAYLIRVDHEPAINTAQDVLMMKKDFYFTPGSFLLNNFQPSNHPFQIMVKRANEKKTFLENTNGSASKTYLLELHNKDAVVLISSDQFPFIIHKAVKAFGYNPFRIGNEPQILDYCGFAFPKGSEWHIPFNLVIMRLREGGILEKMKSDNTLFLENSEKSDNSDTPLKSDHIVVPGVTLALGLVTSAAILVIEKTINDKDRKKITVSIKL